MSAIGLIATANIVGVILYIIYIVITADSDRY
jgi:hypothetical protein